MEQRTAACPAASPSSQAEREMLAASALFAGITPAQLSQLLPCLHARRHSCRRGELLLHEGERTDELGVVLSGRLLLEKTDADGHLSLVRRAGPGEPVGDLAACAAGAPGGFAVVCEAPGTALLLAMPEVTKRCSRACAFHSQLVENLLRLLGQDSLSLNEKIEVLSRRSIREKLLCCLRAQQARAGSASFVLPLTRSQLADYICADRSAMTRELSRMQAEGLVTLAGRRVTLRC